MKKLNKLENIEIDEVGGYAFFYINPRIYSIDVVYAAAYAMIDRAFVILDGDPKNKIKIEIRKKVRHHDLNELVISFNEELLNYATYKVQSEKNKGIREMLLQRVLLTNNPNYFKRQVHEKEIKNVPHEKEKKKRIKKAYNY
jgi:His-Xaa-Ser system protein HxsD